MICSIRRVAIASVALFTLSHESNAQLSYDRTLFLHGFMGGSASWGDTPSWLGQMIYLGPNDFFATNTTPTGTINNQRDQMLSILASYGGRQVLVAHSMGGLVARAALAMDGQSRIAGIVTVSTPHHGTLLADNAQTAYAFFADAQRRVDDGWGAFGVQWIGIPWMIWGSQVRLIDLPTFAALLNSPAVPDLKTTSHTIGALLGQTDAVPHASVYGTIPNRNAVIRLISQTDGDFIGYVKAKNGFRSAMKVCKIIGYAIIVGSGQARACSYADKVLGRIDDRWATFVNGTTNESVTFDGVVTSASSVYPGSTLTGANSFHAQMAAHTNILRTYSGVQQIGNAMMAIGMPRLTPIPLEARIDGADTFYGETVLTFTGSARGATGSYTYSWYYKEDGSDVWQYLGAGDQVTRSVSNVSPSFTLQLNANAESQYGAATIHIVNSNSAGGSCGWVAGTYYPCAMTVIPNVPPRGASAAPVSATPPKPRLNRSRARSRAHGARAN